MCRINFSSFSHSNMNFIYNLSCFVYDCEITFIFLFLSNIIFRNLTLDHVMTPLVVNCFYFCDPDGHSEYVRSKEAGPVDDRLPEISTLTFRNIEATNCHVAAAYMYGLP